MKRLPGHRNDVGAGHDWKLVSVGTGQAAVAVLERVVGGLQRVELGELYQLNQSVRGRGNGSSGRVLDKSSEDPLSELHWQLGIFFLLSTQINLK